MRISRGSRRTGIRSAQRAVRAIGGPRVAGALFSFAVGFSAAARAELVADRITAASFESHRVGGPDADAGVGDWFLGNGTICAAISDPEHESPLSPRGGVLIDLGHCGADDDQWAALQPLLNLSQSEIVPVESVAAGRDEKRAWIQTRGVYQGVEIVTTYGLDAATPTALTVSLRAKRIAAGERVFAVGALALHASGQLSAFSLSRANPGNSRGFVHPASDRSSTGKLLASLVDSDVTILVGGEGSPPISYAIERLAATLASGGAAAEAVSSFSITGGHYSLQNALANPPWLGRASGSPGMFQLAQIPFMDLEPEAELALDYRLWVGERADVASLTDRLFADSPRVRGRVDDPDARVHFSFLSGGAVSEVAPDSNGEFMLRLPPGLYRADARTTAGRATQHDFEVSVDDRSSGISLPAFVLGTPAWIILPELFIGRLTFLHADGSGPVRFGDSRLGFKTGEQAIDSALEADFLTLGGKLGGKAPSPRRIAIAPGTYRVVAVRGPEYEAREVSIEVRAGGEKKLVLEPLRRIAPTPGWLAADLHVHTGQSFDSALPEALQIEAFAASGAEVLVSTEHDRIFDPRPAIAASGLGDELVGVTGSEMTSAYAGGESPYTSGHLNAFPLDVEPQAFRRGAIRLEGRRLRDVLADLRGRERPPFVQINHPRPDPRGGDVDAYFNHLAVAGEPLDPTKPLREWPNSVLIEKSPTHGGRDLDVEAMELMNAADVARYRKTRADWLSFLLQGERIVATANSDSHRLGHVVGLPRNYVRVEDDRVKSFDERAFMAALRGGRTYGSTGPLLNVRLGVAGIGETHAGSKGVLEIAVAAAAWVPIAEWRAYVNGELVHRAPIGRGESAVLPLAFVSDAFVTVEVEGPAEGLYRDVLPGFVPFAFTNPIFVDVDGNGRFDAPGLPEVLPATIATPEQPD